MNITFFTHSGFMAELEQHILIFDYYQEPGVPGIDLNISTLPQKPIYVFASHFHGDHFDRSILDWAQARPDIHYIFSKDIRRVDGAHRMGAHQSLTMDDVAIETLNSTDCGVAFVVTTEGRTLYHAGDLNWWHWNGETENYNRQMAGDYRQEIDSLKGRHIDVAFVPVDPRLEDKYSWGMDYFMRTVGATYAFPMHLWGKFDWCQKLRQDACSTPYREHLMVLHHPLETYSLKKF